MPAPGRDRERTSRPGLSLAVAMLGFFVVALDAQVVNVALSDIRGDLGGGLSGSQWVVTGYTLMFSALLLFGGTLSDRVGARSAYGLGMVLFVVASIACGLANSLGLLVVARVVQGMGAALVTPTSLALIRTAYDDAARRARAISYWALGGAVAAAAGPVLGGALTEVDWRLIFVLNLPVGVLALVLLVRVGASPRRMAPFDWLGQVCAVLGLGALTYAVIEGGDHGYRSTRIIIAVVVALAAAVVFFVDQVRARNPMVPLDLFRARPVTVALAVGFVGMVAFYGVVFLQSLYFQQQRGLSPLQTGLLFLPMTALVAVLNPVAARTALRWGPVVPIVGGLVLMAVGLVALSLVPAGTPVLTVAMLMVPVGVGGSFTVPPGASLIIDSIPAHRAGTASGVLNACRQLGGSLGVAVFGATIAGERSFSHGLRLSLLPTAALLLVTAMASLTLRGSIVARRTRSSE
ncbi:MFS transporter [Frankia sp. R43]|nr:MFS transporter [Frankia sp. R43]